MTTRRAGVVVIVLASTCLLGSCDCGGGGPSVQKDTTADGEDDTGTDTTADGSDVPEDMLDEDGAPAPGHTFTCESAGGGTLSSEHYKIELFAAPVRPVGTTSNENYTIELGPAGVRSP